MLEKLRANVALALLGKAATDVRPNYSGLFTPGQPVYTDMTIAKAVREGYKCSIWVYRGVRTIVQACSAVPWRVEKDGEEIEGHEFTKLMSRPNPVFSGQDMIELLIAHLILGGNGLWQPVMVGGKPREFWPVMPDLFRPVPSTIPGQWLDGWEHTQTRKMLPPESFIHFMQLNPGNPYWGIGSLMAAARTVDTDNEAQDTQKVSMQNRALPVGILTPSAEALGQEDLDLVSAKFKDKFLQKSQHREPWVFNKGMKWESMSLSPVEMDYIASRLQNQRAIAAALGISPIFLGDLEQSSYNNMAEARKALYQDAAIPMLDDIKATLNMAVAPLYPGDITINYDLSNVAALREDFSQKVTAANTLFGMGVPFEQINDQLGLGFSEFAGWNRSYLPFGLMPSGTTPAKSFLKKYAVDNEEQKTRQWQRLDSRRVGWWAVVGKQFEGLYESLGDEVAADPNNLDEIINDSAVGFEKALTASYIAIVEDFGNDTAQDLGMKPKSAKADVFDPFSEAARAWIAENAAEAVKTILATNREYLAAIIAEGFDEGESIYTIGKNIRQFYQDNSKWMAERVARTEVSKAAGYGQFEAAKQSGVVTTLRWLSARDDRVRDRHQVIDGEEVALGGRFSNGLRYPGDADGSPDELINCRCVALQGTAD
jgi:HK97 family phage portal protein